ncbi:hypothetical protein NLG97_g490 [Lecanicillium saksenae]|uniref:Uncharacterized protein n=1 Tax=Lecanicillium saksenae TaxID=468837 RepID=A0ACC1R6C6_9HYPO|nr:hypothetical protein NLG97_g490 [Lecanicillium saksenae]
MATETTSSGLRGLPGLPPEIVKAVLGFLPNSDIKTLRLASSTYASLAPLRLSRVFLSANSLNISVFRAVADHETFRQGVTEIIWDDARLISGTSRGNGTFHHQVHDLSIKNDCPDWFRRARNRNKREYNERTGQEVAHPRLVARRAQFTSSFSIDDSWAYYKGLLQDQAQVLASNADLDAFTHGLDKFPNLRRVTITPLAHGVLFMPIYQTPMIHAFPYGFQYPIPRGWPYFEQGNQQPILALPWAEPLDEYGFHRAEEYRELWRGYRAATRILAERDYALAELVVETRLLHSGVNCYVFDTPNPDYENLCAILRQPALKKLDYSLFVDGQEDDFGIYKNDLLRDALAAATGMEHFSLFTTLEMDEPGVAAQVYDQGPVQNFVPLASVIPVDAWPRLRHFALSGFLVLQSDLIAFLGTLPRSVRTLELNLLMFLDGGNYASLVTGIRDELDWRNRPAQEQIDVTIATAVKHEMVIGVRVWANETINDFLYREGPMPFAVEEGEDPNVIAYGSFGTERDVFDPLRARPYDWAHRQKELGYIDYASKLDFDVREMDDDDDDYD